MARSGAELRRERRLAEITQADLADKIGLSRQTVCTLEARATVPDALADRYLKGVAELTGRAS
jgi:DNA-binding XRE family transcriptional regulator